MGMTARNGKSSSRVLYVEHRRGERNDALDGSGTRHIRDKSRRLPIDFAFTQNCGLNVALNGLKVSVVRSRLRAGGKLIRHGQLWLYLPIIEVRSRCVAGAISTFLH